jgi:hypothetical protein
MVVDLPVQPSDHGVTYLLPPLVPRKSAIGHDLDAIGSWRLRAAIHAGVYSCDAGYRDLAVVAIVASVEHSLPPTSKSHPLPRPLPPPLPLPPFPLPRILLLS